MVGNVIFAQVQELSISRCPKKNKKKKKFQTRVSVGERQQGITANGMGICAVRPSKSIIKVRHLIRRIAYIPCYVPLNLEI